MTTPIPLPPLSELDAVADALGDPTRRAVFKYVAESPKPVTAADVGVMFSVHRTVARAHLERLVESGLLTAHVQHRPEGGRPPKVYQRSERRLDLQMPARQYEVLAELLLTTLESFGEAAELMARRVGFAYGQGLAGYATGEGVDDLLEPWRQAGAEICATSCDGAIEMRSRNCLFREVAARRPRLVCVLDRALLEGLLSGRGAGYRLSEAARRTEGDDTCVLVFRPGIDGAERVVETTETDVQTTEETA